MSKENSISGVILPEYLHSVRDAHAASNTILLPYLIALIPEQLKKMFKIGYGTAPMKYPSATNF